MPSPAAAPPQNAHGGYRRSPPPPGATSSTCSPCFAMSIVGFTVWVTGLSVTVSLLILIVGVFAWVGTVYAFRWTTWVDRKLAGWARGEPIEAAYRSPQKPGFLELLRTLTVDPQTWKDFGWLVLNSVVGFALSLAALTVERGRPRLRLHARLVVVDPRPPASSTGRSNSGSSPSTRRARRSSSPASACSSPPSRSCSTAASCGCMRALAARILGPSESQRLRARVDDLAATPGGRGRGRPGPAGADRARPPRRRPGRASSRSRWSWGWPRRSSRRPRRGARDRAPRRATKRSRRSRSCATSRGACARRCWRNAAYSPRSRPWSGARPCRSTITVVGSLERPPGAGRDRRLLRRRRGADQRRQALRRGARAVALERDDGRAGVTVTDDGTGGADPRRLRPGRAAPSACGRSTARSMVASPPGGPTVVRAELPCG